MDSQIQTISQDHLSDLIDGRQKALKLNFIDFTLPYPSPQPHPSSISFASILKYQSLWFLGLIFCLSVSPVQKQIIHHLSTQPLPISLSSSSPHTFTYEKQKKKPTFILFSLIFAFQPQTPTLILLTVFYFPPLTKPNPLKSIKNKQASQELWWWPRWRCLVHLIVNPFITVFMYEAIELNSVLSNRCLTYTFQSESMVSQFLLIIILLLDLLLIQHHHHHHHTIITIKIKNNFIWKKNMRQTFI